MIRPIVQHDISTREKESVLKKKTFEVTDISLVQDVIIDMHDTLTDLIIDHGAVRGIGLAAPQIGQPLRIAVVELGGKRFTFINPKIIKASDIKRMFRIGCFSLYAYRALIRYPEEVTVSYLDELGKEKALTVSGDSALIIQHEIDHLEGDLIFDRLENKEKGLFVPREKKYTTSHVPFKNYGFVLMLRRKLGFPMKIQSAIQYYSLLFNDSVDVGKYIKESVKRRKELFGLLREITPVSGKIFEAGCGTSALSISLSKEGYAVTCIDLDEDMLFLARRFNRAASGAVAYKQEDILHIKESDDTFDTVYSHGVLEHFSEGDIVKAINEGLRIGKRYIISIPTLFDISNNLLGDENLWTRGKWKRLIAESKGKSVRVIGSFPFHPRLGKLNEYFNQKLSFLAPVLIFVVERK